MIAAALLVVAVGLCVFHGASDGSHGHGISPDLCASLVIVLALPILLNRPVANGWLVRASNRFFRVVSPNLLDRPPEPFPLLVVPGSPCRVLSLA